MYVRIKRAFLANRTCYISLILSAHYSFQTFKLEKYRRLLCPLSYYISIIVIIIITVINLSNVRLRSYMENPNEFYIISIFVYCIFGNS